MNEPTYDELRELFDALRARRNIPNADQNGEWEPPTPIVDWVAAYGLAEDPAQWLAEPLIPDNSAVALFAKGGTGKSLFALWLAAELITRPEPVRVLYLDYEMTIATVVARLEDMGHDDPTTLGHLQYCSLPSLPPLDTQAGGQAVVDMAKHLQVRLVVIDTFGRAVTGKEDLADTVRDWYRWTGQLLKTAGISFLRIDHAGKDMKRGQRGTSAKNDDVDVVWEMTERGRGEFLLRATKRRVDWVEERLVIRQSIDNGMLGYTWDTGVTYRAGAKECAELLDTLGVPVDISRRKAMALLREAGYGKDTNVVADGIRWRKTSKTTPQDHSKPGSETGLETAIKTNTSPQVIPPQDQSRPLGEPDGIGRSTYVSRCPIPGLFDPIEEES